MKKFMNYIKFDVSLDVQNCKLFLDLFCMCNKFYKLVNFKINRIGVEVGIERVKISIDFALDASRYSNFVISNFSKF